MLENPKQHDSQFNSLEYARPQILAASPIAALSTAACRDQMHPGVYKLAVACWAMLLVEFWITFFVSPNALFMVVVGTLYALVFFGVPFLMSRIAGVSSTVPLSLRNFARGRFDTIYGPIGGFEALLQVIMVPLSLGLGGAAIGFIIHSARAAY